MPNFVLPPDTLAHNLESILVVVIWERAANALGA